MTLNSSCDIKDCVDSFKLYENATKIYVNT